MKRILLVCVTVVLAPPAQAHGTLPGGGGFLAGALHPVMAFEQLLALLACGLVLGRDGLRVPLAGLALGLGSGLWLVGTVAGSGPVLVAATLAMGGLLVLQTRLPVWVCGVILSAVGLCVGLETDLTGPDRGSALLGVAAAVFLLTMNAFALGSALAGRRVAIALRIGGAWMFAVALMVLALNLRGGA